MPKAIRTTSPTCTRSPGIVIRTPALRCIRRLSTAADAESNAAAPWPTDPDSAISWYLPAM